MRMGRKLAAMVAGLATMAALVVVPATPAFASTYTTYVSILNPPTPSGIGPVVIDIKDYSMANGGAAQLWLWSTGNNQRWRITQTTSLSAPFGQFTFQNVHSGKCLTAGPPSALGDNTVRQYTCDSSASQKWRAVRVSTINGNWVELVSVQWNTCLDARGYGYGNGVVLQNYPCHGDWNQRFNPYF
ncbi:RICIN domain-containing protein [Herbidospora sp. RD11066]